MSEEEVGLLRDAVRGELAGIEGDGDGWRRVVDGGWLLASVSVAGGGFGDLAAAAAVAQECGHARAAMPVAPALVAAWLLDRVGGEAAAAALAKMMDGAAIAVPAISATAIDGGAATAPAIVDDRLDATVTVIPGGDRAATLLLGARMQDGPVLLALAADMPGVVLDRYRLIDGRGAADLRLDGVVAPAALAQGEAFAAVLAMAADLAATLACAEAIGAMEAAFALTLDYTRQRIQFGRPVASNQAIQHRLVDMLQARREAEILVGVAVRALDGPAAARAAAVSAAKVGIDGAARLIAREAVQMHGAIGTTDEAPVSLFHRRLVALPYLYGGVGAHRRRFADLVLAGGREAA